MAAGSLLVRCAAPDSTGALWVLSVSADDAATVRPAAILPVLVEGVAESFR